MAEKTKFQESVEQLQESKRAVDSSAIDDEEFDENEDNLPPHKEKPDAREKDLANQPPEWFNVPVNWRLPKGGKQVYFHKFLSEWTDIPEKGERQCAIWSNTVGDERFASVNARGKGDERNLEENTKRMIRVVDGEVADWTGRTANVEKFWNEIGPKCRSILKQKYLMLHVMSPMEKMLFFTECSAVLTST